MKKHKIENTIYILSIISLIVFVVSIPVHFITGDSFAFVTFVARLILIFGELSPFVIIIIKLRRKKRGYKQPLSLEAMRNAQNEIPNKIYKFCHLSAGNDKDLDEKKLYSLREEKIWMSDCSVLNDPFEGLFSFVSSEIFNEQNEQIKNIIQTHLNEQERYLQASFSYNYDNILMWGHYANGCRGYCVEFTVNRKDFLFPVQYIDKRPLLSSLTYGKSDTEDLTIFQTNLYKCNLQDRFRYIHYIQSMKSKIWEYENEVRLISIDSFKPNSNKCGNADSGVYGLKASKIIIGYQCHYKEELINIAKMLNIPVSIMEIPLDSKEYKLVEKELQS